MICFGAADVEAKVPLDDAGIKARLLSGAGNMYNPTVMMRRDFLVRHGIRWQAADKSAFDWGFFVEAAKLGARFANLPDTLIHYRIHEGQQSRDQGSLRTTLAAIRLRLMAPLFPQLSADERVLLEPLLQWAMPPDLASAEVQAGLALIPKAQSLKKSVLGEDRAVVHHFLNACEQRWSKALAALPQSS